MQCCWNDSDDSYCGRCQIVTEDYKWSNDFSIHQMKSIFDLYFFQIQFDFKFNFLFYVTLAKSNFISFYSNIHFLIVIYNSLNTNKKNSWRFFLVWNIKQQERKKNRSLSWEFVSATEFWWMWRSFRLRLMCHKNFSSWLFLYRSKREWKKIYKKLSLCRVVSAIFKPNRFHRLTLIENIFMNFSEFFRQNFFHILVILSEISYLMETNFMHEKVIYWSHKDCVLTNNSWDFLDSTSNKR